MYTNSVTKKPKDKLKEVIGSSDHSTALRVGRALESQRFFHDVNYENRLIDDVLEIYQFNELLFHNANNSSTSSSSSSSAASFSVTSTVISDYYDREEELDDEEEDNESTTTSTTITQQPTSPLQTSLLNGSGSSTLPLPNGIYVELTHCYSPTCNNLSPCYSYTCPKRERLVKYS